MKKIQKLFLLLLCAVTVGSAMAVRGGRGGRGGVRRGGFRRGGIRHGGFRRGGWGGWYGGWRRPYFGGFGLGIAPTVVVDTSSYVTERPASLDTFISKYGRPPVSANEFCRWIAFTGRQPDQCDLYRRYHNY